MSGKEIKQSEVDDRLSRFLAKEEKDKEELHRSLRQSYSFQSDRTHPNLNSLRLRTGGSDETTFNEIVGVNHFWGGLLSLPLGKAAIVDVLMTILLALKVISAIYDERTGRWREEYSRIEGEWRRYISEVKAQIPQEVEGGENQ